MNVSGSPRTTGELTMYARSASAPYSSSTSRGSGKLRLLLDIFCPSEAKTIPFTITFLYGLLPKSEVPKTSKV